MASHWSQNKIQNPPWSTKLYLILPPPAYLTSFIWFHVLTGFCGLATLTFCWFQKFRILLRNWDLCTFCSLCWECFLLFICMSPPFCPHHSPDFSPFLQVCSPQWSFPAQLGEAGPLDADMISCIPMQPLTPLYLNNEPILSFYPLCHSCLAIYYSYTLQDGIQ